MSDENCTRTSCPWAVSAARRVAVDVTTPFMVGTQVSVVSSIFMVVASQLLVISAYYNEGRVTYFAEDTKFISSTPQKS